MKTIGEIRLENLELLIAAEGTLDAVAEKAGTSSVYLSQVRNGARDQKTGRPRQMGDQMARRLETAFDKALGWMDTPHPAIGANKRIPDHGFEIAGRGGNIIGIPVKGSSFFLPLPEGMEIDRDDPAAKGVVLGSGVHDGYAVRVRGDANAPALKDGQFVIIESAPARIGDLAIFHFEDATAMVFELLGETDDAYYVDSPAWGSRETLDKTDVAYTEAVVAVASPSRFRPHIEIDPEKK
jgi:hypothetical protein